MKIVIFSAYPLVDNLYYKKIFLKGIAERRSSLSAIVLVYSPCGIMSYLNKAISMAPFGFRDLLQKVSLSWKIDHHGSKMVPDSDNRTSLCQLSRELGIEVKKFAHLNSEVCEGFLHGFSPDIIFNLAGVYIPRNILRIPVLGVVGGHYGLLPAIRGGDTIRWSILLDVPIYVSHMFLVNTMDMGDIISLRPVFVEKGDTIQQIRFKCQIENAHGHLHVLDKLMAGNLKAKPQKEAEGSMYYRMGKRLCEKTDQILKSNRYSHYCRVKK